MTRSFVRDNAFLIAAICLPVLVAALFLLASVVPQATVPPPAYDLVFKVELPYGARPPSGVAVDFEVRDGRVHARVSPPLPAASYAQGWALFRFDHLTLEVREIPFEPPAESGSAVVRQTLPVEALAGQRLLTATRAPDGYELQNRTGEGGGLVGELFGVGTRRRRPALVREGRAVELNLPARYIELYQPPVYTLGWVAGGEAR
jgi:hypothetical protein